MFSKAVGLVVVSEGGFVFLVPRGKPPTSFSDLSLVTIRAGEFACN